MLSDVHRAYHGCYGGIGHHHISVLPLDFVQGKPQSRHFAIVASPPLSFQPLLLNGKTDGFVDDRHGYERGKKENADAKNIFTRWRLNPAEVDDGFVHLDCPTDNTT